MDEFGLWVHLGGSYWQRASYDAVVVVTAVLGLIALARRLGRLRSHHATAASALQVGLVLFTVLLRESLKYAEDVAAPRLRLLERQGPQ